jgi:putative peptidoglycan lipid II flippase
MEADSQLKKGFLKSAALLAIAMVISQIIGLLSKSLIGSTFGASAEVDAFLASNRLTEILFNLVAGGALASAFVPMFSAMLDRKETRRAWQLASRLSVLLTLILAFLSLLCYLFAAQIVRYILVPGFSINDPALEQLTVDLLRIQLPTVVIFGLSGLLMGILNSHDQFLFPGLAPAMYQIGIILGVLFFSKPFGIRGLAYGAVTGSLLHLLIQLPMFLRLKNKELKLEFAWKDSAVREVFKLMIPRQIGASAVQLNFLVNNLIASYLPAGSISAITWGLALMLMPQAAIAQSVATVSLPMFSVQAARNKLPEMSASLAAVIRLVIWLALPAACGLILLGEPIVTLIFERRAFNPQMTQMVTWALIWYSFGLVFHCVVELVSRAFYAIHDTKTPVMVLFFAMLLNIVLSILLSRAFAGIGWMPHGGVALANTIATALESGLLLFLMRRRLQGLHGGRILTGILQSVVAATAMSLGLYFWIRFSAAQEMLPLVVVAVGVVAGIGIYLAVGAVLKTDELKEIRNFIMRRHQLSEDS